jgi:hypothetical protein
VFGKGAAEIIARGTPRAAGIDLSTRVGEQDILPFSKFIADRRDLKDSLKDLESRAWGAPSSMMLNMATGAQRVAQGDLEGGFRQMLPLGLVVDGQGLPDDGQGLHRFKGQRAADGAERARFSPRRSASTRRRTPSTTRRAATRCSGRPCSSGSPPVSGARSSTR